MKDINKYKLVYSITALPNILFGGITTGDRPLSFDSEKFLIPPQVKEIPIELRIYLFDPNDSLVEMTSNILPPSSNIVCRTAELTGLKLVKKLLDN